MTDNQKLEIAKLRNLGLEDKAIAAKLNIPVDNIKGYCQQSGDANRYPERTLLREKLRLLHQNLLLRGQNGQPN